MRKTTVVLGLAASLFLTPLSAALAQGAPSQALVGKLITEVYKPGGGNAYLKVDIHSIEIGAGHRASAHEGMQYQVSLGQMIYPIHASWTNTTGSGPSAYVRDYDTHYFLFQSAQKGGAWDLTSNSMPGDKIGVLRGG